MRAQKTSDDEKEHRLRDLETIGSPFKKQLSDSGGGDGVSLHFDAPLAREYDLNSDTEVEVSVVEKGGDVAFRIDIPAGFTHKELEIFASQKGWKLVDRYLAEDGEWSFTYQTENGEARISIDSESRIDGHHVNNVIIESAVIELRKYNDYEKVSPIALRKNLGVRLRDSEGLWQRLRASTEHETEDAPDEETAKQLLKIADWVTVQLVDQKTSTKTTLTEIGQVVDNIAEATKELDEKAHGNIHWLEFDDHRPDDESGMQVELGTTVSENET